MRASVMGQLTEERASRGIRGASAHVVRTVPVTCQVIVSGGACHLGSEGPG